MPRNICPDCGEKKRPESKRCRDCHLAKNARPANYLDRECPKCHKMFRVHKAHVERGQGVYCSRSCARSGSPARKRVRVTLTCHLCAETFERRPCELAKAVTDKSFCSLWCWYEYAQWENHPGWKGGQHDRMNPEAYRWKKAIFKRDGGACRMCGSASQLQYHHIKMFAACPEHRWNPRNGILLCKGHHDQLRGREDEYEPLLHFMALQTVHVVDSEDDFLPAIERMARRDGPDFEAFGYTVASGFILPPQACAQTQG